MGLIFNEKHYEETEHGERWYFNLCGWGDPAADYICFITRQCWIDGQWRNMTEEPSHKRLFDPAKFHDKHYASFRKKFAKDPDYRKKWLDTKAG